MHPTQYEDFKSGKAKERFLEDLENRKNKKIAAANTVPAAAPIPVPINTAPVQPKVLNIDVDGEQYRVTVSYDEVANASDSVNQIAPTPEPNAAQPMAEPPSKTKSEGNFQSITAPLEGKFYLTRESGETPVKIGDTIKTGDTIAYIEAMKVINAITSDKSGKVVEIVARNGEEVEEDDILIKLQ